MKKFVLGLLIALLAFLCGVFSAGIFRPEMKTAAVPAVPQIQVEEERKAEIPYFRIGQLEESEEIESAESPAHQNIYGWYSLERNAELPELKMIMLSNDVSRNEDETKIEKTASSSGVFTDFENYGDQGFVDDAWTKIDGRKVSFKSNKIKGIEYRFEGFFFKNKTMGAEGEKLLRGTLQKYVKGKKVAETSGDFAYYEPHCWH